MKVRSVVLEIDDDVRCKFVDGDWLDIAPPEEDDTDAAEIRRCGLGTVGGGGCVEGAASSLSMVLQGGVDDLDEAFIGCLSCDCGKYCIADAVDDNDNVDDDIS